MQNEGASKGILVTTSGYGNSSFQFAEGKPLELLSGTHLLYLLAENAGNRSADRTAGGLGRSRRRHRGTGRSTTIARSVPGDRFGESQAVSGLDEEGRHKG